MITLTFWRKREVDAIESSVTSQSTWVRDLSPDQPKEKLSEEHVQLEKMPTGYVQIVKRICYHYRIMGPNLCVQQDRKGFFSSIRFIVLTLV